VLAGAELPKEGPLPLSKPEQRQADETKAAPAEDAKAEAARKAKDEEEKAKQRPQEDTK
jgi:hypothetical protein